VAAAAGLAAGASQTAANRKIQVKAEQVVNEVGSLTSEQMEMGRAMHMAIPAELHQALGSEEGARAIVYCLVLDLERRTRERQVNLIVKGDNNQVAKLAWELWEHVNDLGLAFRQPLLDLAVGVISYSDSETRHKMTKTLQDIIMYDGKVDFSELILMLAVSPHLSDDALKGPRNKYRHLGRLKAELSVVLGLLAKAGSDKEQAQMQAFNVAIEHTQLTEVKFPAEEQMSFGVLNSALNKLRQLVPAKKQLLFEACVAMVLHDDEVTLREYELLRLMSNALECPLPPKIADAA